jgi:hypothetical protein
MRACASLRMFRDQLAILHRLRGLSPFERSDVVDEPVICDGAAICSAYPELLFRIAQKKRESDCSMPCNISMFQHL